MMNTDPDTIADLQACSGYGSQQDDRPGRMSGRDSGSDRKGQHYRHYGDQDHHFEALSKRRTNQ